MLHDYLLTSFVHLCVFPSRRCLVKHPSYSRCLMKYTECSVNESVYSQMLRVNYGKIWKLLLPPKEAFIELCDFHAMDILQVYIVIRSRGNWMPPDVLLSQSEV